MKIDIPEPVLAVGYAKSVWITVDNFEFTVTIDGKEITFIIPSGFVTDFYSIPRFLHWWRSNNEGWGNEASLIHDFLRRYYTDFNISVKLVDKIFYYSMKYFKLKIRHINYIAVRLFVCFTDEGGYGKPGKKIRKIMNKKGYDWKDYRKKVLQVNGLKENNG